MKERGRYLPIHIFMTCCCKLASCSSSGPSGHYTRDIGRVIPCDQLRTDYWGGGGDLGASTHHAKTEGVETEFRLHSLQLA